MAFVTKAEARVIDPTLTDMTDAVLDALLDAACDSINDGCFREFEDDDYVERYSGSNDTLLVLRNSPIDEVAFVKITTGSVVRTYDSTTDPTITSAFDIDANAGILRVKPTYPFPFPEGYKNIEVSYSTTGAVTAAVQLAVVLLVKDFANVMKRAGSGIAKERLGDYSVEFDLQSMGGVVHPWPQSVARLLAPYIRHSNGIGTCPLNP